MGQAVRALAADLRRRARLETPPFSPFELAERVFPETLVTGGQLRPGVEVAAARASDGPTIVYARELPGPEKSMAIMIAIARVHFCLPDDQCEAFAAEFMAPLEQLAPLVRKLPGQDADDLELYGDHLDELAAKFGVPASVIDSQIRALEMADHHG